MSDLRDPATDQALPTINERPFIQDLVISDIEERKQHGIRKYGTALQSGNGRDMLLDAYEEALDLAIYLRGLLDEQQRARAAETWWVTTYWLDGARPGKKLAGPYATDAEAMAARASIEEHAKCYSLFVCPERAQPSGPTP